MKLPDYALKGLARTTYVSVGLFGLAIVNTAIIRLWPSPFAVFSTVFCWTACWININMALAFRDRLDLLHRLADDDHRNAIVIHSVPLVSHGLAHMFFLDPMRLYNLGGEMRRRR